MASPASHLIIGLLRLTCLKRWSENAAVLRRVIAFQRKALPGRLPKKFLSRYAVTEKTVHGHKVYTLAPRQNVGPDHILYIHGGGYIFDILWFHWRLAGYLIDKTGCTITVPLYPLAPEYQARDAFAMVFDLYKKLVGSTDRGALAIMGDSAGGGLGLAVAQAAREEGLPQPSRIVLLSPWLDVAMTNPAIPALAHRDPLLSPLAAIAVGRLYAGDLDVEDPRVSPLHGSLEGLAPIMVFTGRRDILNPDARRLRDLASKAGVALTFFEAAEMMHAWMLLPSPEGAAAREQIAFLFNPPLVKGYG